MPGEASAPCLPFSPPPPPFKRHSLAFCGKRITAGTELRQAGRRPPPPTMTHGAAGGDDPERQGQSCCAPDARTHTHTHVCPPRRRLCSRPGRLPGACLQLVPGPGLVPRGHRDPRPEPCSCRPAGHESRTRGARAERGEGRRHFWGALPMAGARAVGVGVSDSRPRSPGRARDVTVYVAPSAPLLSPSDARAPPGVTIERQASGGHSPASPRAARK